MELHGWQQCQRKPLECTGTLNLLPPSWDKISAIYKQVLKLVSKFPYSKRLVLYFAYKGTSVKLDLGDVKAAGVVCILGLGVGLGTLFIYSLYRQYVQPFLDTQCTDPETQSSSDCNLVDFSDSGVDGAMGNNSSGPTPAVFYSPQYGVALGGRGLSPRPQVHSVADKVRLRRMGTRCKPARRYTPERDNRSTGSSDLSPSPYEANIRDSFYSTAESGFETLPEFNEEEEDSEGNERLSQSLRENYSVSSLKERNNRYFLSLSGDNACSSPSGGKTVVDVLDNDGKSSSPSLPVVHTELVASSNKSSPAHRGNRIPDAHLLCARKCNHPHSEDYDYDPSLDASESIRSFNSSGEEWSWEDEDKDLSPFPLAHTAMTDSQFRQSLMQRIREWSTFAEEYGKSRSPTPDCSSPPHPHLMRRSRSLDHQLGEPVHAPDVYMSASEPIKVEDSTIKNLECLETEFHNIQDEFESITCKLHELIERGATEGTQQQSSIKQVPYPLPNHVHSPHRKSRPRGHNISPHHRPRTKWERMPSLARSDSSPSSRASSVEFSWDCGEMDGAGEVVGVGFREEEVSGLSCKIMGTRKDFTGLALEQDGDSEPGVENNMKKMVNIGDAVPIIEYAEQEWRGDTPKAKTIKQGYFSVPDLFQCKQLRQIRGDNYCALRSTLFQVLVGGHRVTLRWPGLISIVDRLHKLSTNSNSGLEQWTFAERLAWGGEEDKFSKVTQCVLSLYATIEEMSALPSQEERLARTLSLLNGSERFDTELMEGLKLMMLFRANDLQEEMREGGDVPTFAWLLFARDTSPDVVSFVRNHLNCVGDSAGIDQVEMCLLGHCLGMKLRVARLDHHGQEDFDCTFPDEAPEDWPSAYLLAEDDRHYNVPVA